MSKFSPELFPPDDCHEAAEIMATMMAASDYHTKNRHGLSKAHMLLAVGAMYEALKSK